MPLTNARADARVATAVGYMNTFFGVTVPDAMKLAFSKEEKAWLDKQMWIRLRITKQMTTLITNPTTSIHVDNACVTAEAHHLCQRQRLRHLIDGEEDPMAS